MAFLRKKREDPRVDLTPMVDVVFLLLIFFMISTTFVETPGLTVDLPESSSQAEMKEPDEIKVYVARDGAIAIGDQKVSLDQFRQRLQAFGEKAADTTFVLLADKEAYHGRVVQLMDEARQAGFKKLAIATESAER
ncbi:MAG: ExbD/TolR family protein [Desulfuromonadales bacterium]|uniref:ExbD/TolR family protein n=1 Tax=Desulfuromonas sp. KJ2020 TaxID=2919173 RepID=UPI0020A83506|nr:biopolymer transporter ExbD [Desulfuromonas sp. KJ2020]MCP3178182.1 biopolymer transporter ExbD [Desulfuromonas sp. KJ2020]